MEAADRKDPIGLSHTNIVLGTCPQCKTGHLFDKGTMYGCVNYPNCKFSINKEILGAKISSTAVSQLLSDKTTSNRIKFVKEDENGKPKEFFAHLALKRDEGGAWKLSFNFDVPLGSCPKCKTGKIYEKDKCYKCNNPSCGAYAFKTYYSAKLSPSHIAKLLVDPHQVSIQIETKMKAKRRVMLHMKDVFKEQDKK